MSQRLRAVSFLLLLLTATASRAQTTLFSDDFQRTNSSTVGQGWTEYLMRARRDGTVDRRPGNGDWVIRSGALSCAMSPDGRYAEDFVVTSERFPVEGTQVVFELRGRMQPQADGGPGVGWLADPQAYSGASTQGFIGLAAHVMAGSTSVDLLANGAAFPQVGGMGFRFSDKEWVPHRLSVQDGFLTYQIGSAEPVSVRIQPPLEAARRHFLVALRAQGRGWHVADIRGFRITSGGAAVAQVPPSLPPPSITSPPPPPPLATPPTVASPSAEGDYITGLLGRSAYSASALAASRGKDPQRGSVVLLHGAPSQEQLSRQVETWSLSFRGEGPGTYEAGNETAAITFSRGPDDFFLPRPDCRVTVTRFEDGVVEGAFSGAFEHHAGGKVEVVPGSGSFRASIE